MQPEPQPETDLGVQGVLLYYAFRDLSVCGVQADAREWYERQCSEQGLVGRVRIALDGVNATLGGSLVALRQHADAVDARFGPGGPAIDFKLAESSGARNAAMMRQSGFDRLSVQTCKEVVSLGVMDWLPAGSSSGPSRPSGGGSASSAGLLPAGARHVEPQEFHALLAEAAAAGEGSGGNGDGSSSDTGCGSGGGSIADDGGTSSDSSTCAGSSSGDPRGNERGASKAKVAGAVKETVLLDTRNFYETRVGRFEVPGVPLLDPGVRCFSDTPAWLEANQHLLANRRILMYCTGGVRCERASAYLMSLGSCFKDVVQLRGGIQRYLEAYPNGGFFRGSNFVFDERGGVEAGSGTVVGQCVGCSRPWGDYSHRRRCASCRMLLLVCDACVAATPAAHTLHGGVYDGDGDVAHAESAEGVGQAGIDSQHVVHLQPVSEDNKPQQQQQQWDQQQWDQQQQQLTCELCVRRRQQQAESGGGGGGRCLRILCLHGFRQSARNFEGRTHGLRKRLRDLAEFVFVDAPHQLPAWTKSAPAAAERQDGEGEGVLLHSIAQQAKQAAGNAAQVETAMSHPLLQQQEQEQQGQQQRRQLSDRDEGHQRGGPPRRAWLLTAEQYAVQQREQEQEAQQDRAQGQEQGKDRHQLQQEGQEEHQEQRQGQDQGPSVGPAAAYVDEWQYQAQTAGWSESEQELDRVLREQGPFDGVLGFSQGAAVAGVLAARQYLQGQQQQQRQEGVRLPATAQPPLRFAVMCSGYRSPLPEHEQLLDAAAQAGGAALPTLHIYGTSCQDRQISAQDSVALADCFDPTQRFVIRHAGGHIIPASKAVVGRIRDFLMHVQQQGQQQQGQQQGQQQQQQQGLEHREQHRHEWKGDTEQSLKEQQ